MNIFKIRVEILMKIMKSFKLLIKNKMSKKKRKFLMKFQQKITNLFLKKISKLFKIRLNNLTKIINNTKNIYLINLLLKTNQIKLVVKF